MTEKIDLTSLIKILPGIRTGKIVVLVTGVFDLLHSEHRNFLQAAKKAGDILLVGLEADQRVRQLKGGDRPIYKLGQRISNMVKTGIPDFVFSLPQKFNQLEDYESLIKELRPDFLAVSSHTGYLEVKERVMKKFGGRLKIVLQHNPDISTTKLLKIKNENIKM